MNKEEQHIDQLLQSLKEDKFVAPQSFLDDLKLRVDAKAKLAARRKTILWFVLTSIVLVTIASIFIYTEHKHSVSESTRKLSLTEVHLNANTDKTELENKNQNSAVRFDSAKLKIDVIENEVKLQQEEIGRNDLEHQNPKNSSDLNESFKKSTKKTASPSRKNTANKQASKTNKSNIFVANSAGNKLQKTAVDLPGNNTEVSRKSQATKKDALDSKSMLTASATAENSNRKNSDLQEKLSIGSAHSNQTDSNSRDLVLLTRTTKPIDNPIHVSLVEYQSPLTTSNAVNKASQNLEFNIEAYGGALFTSNKYNPTSLADGYKSSPLFFPSFGLKTSLLLRNVYSSVGVEYFKTGDQQAFDTKTFSQIGIDSVETGFYLDTVWIDSMIFYIDSVVDYQITPIMDSMTNSNTFTNQYSWISIPLSFGYRFQYNSWDFIPNVGVNLNFGIGQNSGQYPDASNQLVKYNALKFNMDIRIQTEVRKNFGKYYVFVSPYFKKNLKPIISYPSLRLTQHNWGLNGGFGIKF